MALARVSLVDNQIIVRPFGSELLTPLVTLASGHADDAEAAAAAAAATLEDAQALTGAHTVDLTSVDAAETTVVYGVAAAGTAASDRYYHELQGANLYLENVFASKGWHGSRTMNAVVKDGRTATFRLDFLSTNFSAQNGIGFAFDDGETTGADAVLAADATIIGSRAGVVTTETGIGGTASGYTVTQTSVAAAPTPVAGDAFYATIDLGTPELCTIYIQKGAVVGTYTIEPRPPGKRFVPVARFNDGTGTAHPSGANPRSLMYPMSWSDPTVTNVTEEITNVIGTILSLSDAGPTRLTTMPTASDDANAYTARTLPTGMRQPPVMPLIVHGYGDVTFETDLLSAFLARYPSIKTAPIAFLDGTNGVDVTGALGDRSLPYKTYKAAAMDGARIIAVEDGGTDPYDLRFSDAGYLGVPLLIIALNPGRASFRVRGDDLNAITPTDTGDGIWEFVLPCANANAAPYVHRVTRSDVVDSYGRATELLQHASDAALRAAGTGWWIGTAGGDDKKLRIGIGGGSVAAIKAYLTAYMLDSGANARTFAYDAEVFTYGMDYEGVHMYALHVAASGKRAFAWRQRFTSRYSSDYGASAGAGGGVYEWDGVVIAPEKDGWNTNWVNDLGEYAGYGLLLVEGGAKASSGTTTGNTQAGSSHSGHALIAACRAVNNYGQQFADTTLLGAGTNLSWYVGNYIPASVYETGSPNPASPNPLDVGVVLQGASGAGAHNRAGWFDTNYIGSAIPLQLDALATAKLFNNNFEIADVALTTSSVAPTTYTPGAP